MRFRAALLGASLLGCVPTTAKPVAPSGLVAADASDVLAGGVEAVTISANGRFAAFGGPAGVQVIELPTRRLVRFFGEARVTAPALALSPEGKMLAAAGRDGRVRLWDVPSGKVTGVLDGNGTSTALAFSPSGDLLALGGEALSFDLWDVAKQRWVWRKSARSAAGQVRSLVFSADGRLLVSGTRVDLSGGLESEEALWQESPRLWEVASGDQLAAFDEGQVMVGISNDGRRLIGAGGTAVRVWERGSGAEIATLAHWPERTSGLFVTGVALTPEGTRALSLGSDGTLILWDVAAEKALARVAAHARDATALALSPDGRQALTGARDGHFRLWDVQDLSEIGGATAPEAGRAVAARQ